MSLLNAPREPELFPEDELRAAAGAVREAMLAALNKDEDPGRTFSPAFAIRMEPLLRLDRRRTGRRRFLQRAAVFLLAVLLTGTLILAVNPDARAAFFGWVRTMYEKSVRYDFTSEEPNIPNINGYIDSIKIPEVDFSQLSGEYEIEQLAGGKYNITYMITGKDDSVIFIFQCLRADVYSSAVLDFHDGYSYEAVSIYGVDADYYESRTGEDCNALLWWDEEAMFSYNLVSYAEKESIVEIAEIIIKNN